MRLTEAQIGAAIARSDIHGLLAIPQRRTPKRQYTPPKWPLYATLLTIALSMAGLVALRHAGLHFAAHSCNSQVEVCP